MLATLNPATAGGVLSLEDYVALAARHGFKGVEFSIDAAKNLGLEAARELFASHSVSPATFGLDVEWRTDEAAFRAGLDNLEAQAQFAQQLGSTRCCTWVLPAYDEPAAQYAARATGRFVQIAKILGDHGIAFGLEFIGPHHFRTNPANVWFYDIEGGLAVAEEINGRAGTNNVGLLVDAFHWHTSEGSVMDLAAIPLERIVHVHINDAPQGLEVAEIQDSVRELPGATGTIDLTAFLTTLKNIGYTGPVAVEVFSAALRAMTPEEAATEAENSVREVFEQAGLAF